MIKDRFFDLLSDSIAYEECPICNATEKEVKRHIDMLLYESVNDVGVRQDIRKALGFCNRHMDLLLSYNDILGDALIAQDLVKEVLTKDFNVKKNGLCPICIFENNIEKLFEDTFINALKEKSFREKLSEKRSILCLNHFRKIYNKLNGEAKEFLYATEKKNLSHLKDELDEEVEHFDYTNKGKKWKDEKNAHTRAFRFLLGKEFINSNHHT